MKSSPFAVSELLSRLGRLSLPGTSLCHVARDPQEATAVGEDEEAAPGSESAQAAARVWRDTLALYRTRAHPAIQVCIRQAGRIVLHRAVGFASGAAPGEPRDGPRIPIDLDTPFCLFSTAKAVTAMVIHKLDEKRSLHLEDRVCDFIPEFALHGKHRITIRHLLAHRAGIPNLPPDTIDLELLADPPRVVQILCEQRTRTRPGRILAYHAVSGGFVLGEVVRRVTGRDIRSVLEREIAGPLGFRWLGYGVRREDLPRVAHNAVTGFPAPPPFAQILRNALGTSLEHVTDLSNDPRFLTGIVPSANVVATAGELAAFFQCLLDGGELGGVRVFDPATVRHATGEQSYRELDFTLGLPLRYGLGFMLGSHGPNLFGWDNPDAFGHAGLSNIFGWADPERELAVAILTSGKPVVGLHLPSLLGLLIGINQAFPKTRPHAAPVRPARRAVA